MFQGTVAEFKPFRDWLTEILNCALGWFSFRVRQAEDGHPYSGGADRNPSRSARCSTSR